MLKACFSSSLRSDRSLRERPKSAVADFVEQALVHLSGTAIPHRYMLVVEFPLEAGWRCRRDYIN